MRGARGDYVIPCVHVRVWHDDPHWLFPKKSRTFSSAKAIYKRLLILDIELDAQQWRQFHRHCKLVTVSVHDGANEQGILGGLRFAQGCALLPLLLLSVLDEVGDGDHLEPVQPAEPLQVLSACLRAKSAGMCQTMPHSLPRGLEQEALLRPSR